MTTHPTLTPIPSTPTTAPIRILHAVGHLTRGGIETWLYQTIRRMDPTRFEHHILVLTAAEEPFTADFRAAGIHIHPCPALRRPHRFAAGMRRILRDHGPFDVLHAHGFSALTTAALAVGRGVPIRILHGHNDLRPRMARAGRPYRLYTHASLALQRLLANRAVACGRLAADWTFGPNKPAELLIGADLDTCMLPPDPTLRAKLGIPPDRFVLAQVARFTVAKNHAFTLALARELEVRALPFHLLLIGDGPLRASTLQGLEAAGLSHRLTWLENSKEVPAILAGVVDLALLPSLNEGLPLASLEAQAAAVPLLISNTVSRECAIDPSLVNFLPLDQGPTPWADRIVHRLAQPRPTITPAHRERILSSRFHLSHSVERLSALYQGHPK